ncbi:MAG: hypothetical protein WCD12_20650 [Candidatus Binatus sp.]|uniref:hypothetical protein n=1 Tax=Candidatus Binatus sp. TaxID=2811406 RepID=UPI003C77EE61
MRPTTRLLAGTRAALLGSATHKPAATALAVSLPPDSPPDTLVEFALVARQVKLKL